MANKIQIYQHVIFQTFVNTKHNTHLFINKSLTNIVCCVLCILIKLTDVYLNEDDSV